MKHALEFMESNTNTVRAFSRFNLWGEGIIEEFAEHGICGCNLISFGAVFLAGAVQVAFDRCF